MDAPEKQDSPNATAAFDRRGALEHFRFYLPAFAFLVVATSTLYLWGYWGAFDINVLEFLSASDILRVAAIPLASGVVSILAGVFVGEFVFKTPALSEGGGSDTKIGKFLRTYWAPIVGVLYILILGLLFYGPPQKWFVAGVTVAIPTAVALRRSGLWPSTGSDSLDRSLCYSICVCVLASYGVGANRAAFIVDGTSYRYQSVASLGGPYSSDAGAIINQARYIGVAGDKAFFYRPDNKAVVIVELSKLNRFELNPKPEP